MVFMYERASIMVQMFLFIYLTMYLHIPAKAYFRSTGFVNTCVSRNKQSSANIQSQSVEESCPKADVGTESVPQELDLPEDTDVKELTVSKTVHNELETYTKKLVHQNQKVFKQITPTVTATPPVTLN